MAQPTVQIPTITVGTRLTDYATVDLRVEGLAAGGMGLVVWGKNVARGNEMQALKLLKPERVAAAVYSDKQRRTVERQFEDEALVWCHLWPHQCVITTTGLTRFPALASLPVLVLQFAPNGSLRDQLRLDRAEHSLTALRSAFAWAIHIASALAHMHQPDPDHDRPAPLVHCDLKPENVLLNEQGWAQLTDLGLTRAYAALTAESSNEAAYGSALESGSPLGAPALTPHQAEVARLRAVLQDAGALPPAVVPPAETLFATRTLRIPPAYALAAAATPAAPAPKAALAAIGTRGPVAGSPPYMAPEQWEGLKAAVPATDLYAFGVLLFELFAGTEAPYPFPFDPTPYFTAALTGRALATGYDPVLLAWHAAHTAPSGPAHHLTDPEVAAAALRSGPLAELASRGDAAGRRAADSALRQVDALVRACLAPDPGARPTAAAAQQHLAALVSDPCGLEPVHMPAALPNVAQNESAFWGNLGITYSRLDRQEEAIATKRRAIEYSPSDPSQWMNLAASLDHLGERKVGEAVEAMAAGDSAEASALTADARQLFEEALIACQQAESHLTPAVLAADPLRPARIATVQGGTFANLGRFAEAVAADQRALALQPDRHDTRFLLALHYARWTQVPDTTPDERLERLHAAQRELQTVLAVAPNFNQGRALAERLALALADPAHRFVG